MAAPALLGFGLFLAWSTCAPLVHNLVGPQASGFGPLVSPLLHALFLLAFAVAFNYRRRDLYSSRLVALLGACIAVAVGVRALAAGSRAFLAGVADISEALARAGLFLLWVEQYARFAQRTAWPAYALSFGLVPVAYFAVVSLPGAVGFGAVYAMLAGSCALLWVCGRRAACGGDSGEAAVAAACTWRVPWRPAALMAAFSFAYYMLMHLTGGSSAMGELGNLLAAAGMLALCLGAFDRINLHVLYKVFLSLSVCTLLAYAQGVWPLGDVASLLSYAGFNGFTLLVLFVLNGICYRYGVRAVWLFGVVQACEVAAHALGSALGSSLAQLDGAQPLLVAAAVDGAAAVLVVLGVFLLSERDFSSTWGVAPVGRREGPGEVEERTAMPEELPDAARPLLGSYYEDFVWRCSRVARHYGLTHREEEVLALLAQNKTSAEIEATLFISHNTAKGHLRHVYDELGVHSREEAAAVVRGWR